MKNRRRFLRDCSCLSFWAAFSSGVLPAGAASAPGIELEPFSCASFRRCLDSTFRIDEGHASGIGLTLTGVEALSPSASGGTDRLERSGECFLLTFCGAADAALAQDTYAFDHLVLGRFAMLIVPMFSRDPQRAYYQAVFNRAMPTAAQVQPRDAAAAYV